MKPAAKLFVSAPVLFVLAACTSIPPGPKAMALPGSGMSFETFRADDSDCQQFAAGRVGGKTSDQVAAEAGVNSALVGAAVGAATGAAINGGQGAATGAGVGGAMGAVAGTGAAAASSYELQQRYDSAYLQCMYAKGHKVPVYGKFVSPGQQAQQGPRVGRYYPPPPPPGQR